MSNFVDQSKLLGTRPVIYNVCNFSKPAPGRAGAHQLSAMSLRMFHEFGHALHGMFADSQYPTLSGTAVPRDFVEFPSQFNEHWATYPAVFSNYAKHYKTGAPMPAELADKIKKTKTFNQGYALTEVLAAAQLDMQWHTLPASTPAAEIQMRSKPLPWRRPASLCKPCRRAIAPLTLLTSGAAIMALDITLICGLKCWTMTPSNGSRITAD